MRISKTINILQSKYNLTIPQLSELSGVTRKSIHEWKRRTVEKVPPKAARLVAIEEIFELFLLCGAKSEELVESLNIEVPFDGKQTTLKDLIRLLPKSPILLLVAELAYCAKRGVL